MSHGDHDVGSEVTSGLDRNRAHQATVHILSAIDLHRLKNAGTLLEARTAMAGVAPLENDKLAGLQVGRDHRQGALSASMGRF